MFREFEKQNCPSQSYALVARRNC